MGQGSAGLDSLVALDTQDIGKLPLIHIGSLLPMSDQPIQRLPCAVLRCYPPNPEVLHRFLTSGTSRVDHERDDAAFW